MKSTSDSLFVKYFTLVVSLFCLLFLAVIFISTSPDNASPVLLLVIFILQYGFIFGVIKGMFLFFEKIRRLFFVNLPLKNSLAYNKKNRLTAFLSLVPIIVLAIQSIKPIGLYELALVAILTVFGAVIISKK